MVGVGDHPLAEVEELGSPSVQASGYQGQDLGHLFHVAGFSVGRKPHHLVLVAVMGKSQELGKGRVEKPHGGREVHGLQNLDFGSLALAQHRGGKIPRAIDAQDGSFLVRRGIKGTGEVAPVVFDELQLGADHCGVHTGLHFPEALVEQLDVVLIRSALVPKGLSDARMLQNERHFVEPFCPRIAADGDGGEVC